MSEPRITVRSLAARVGVTDETVTARLRRLRETNVLATTVMIDSQLAGYGAGAIVRIKAPQTGIDTLTKRFLALPSIQFVAAAMGACDLVVAILGVHLADIRAVLQSALGGVDNVRLLGVDVVTGALAYDMHSLTLPIQAWSPEDLPAPRPALDELDCALISQLAVAGHESNREIARRLGMSDATVRSRIRRLEQAGLMRLVAGVDPVGAGERQLFAMVFVVIDDDRAVRPLVGRRLVTTCMQTVGLADLVLQIGGRAVHELSDFVSELSAVDGVRDVAIAYLTEVGLHRNHLARLDVSSPGVQSDGTSL
ncbi:hypothetical protein MMOR_01330 [Mycolicibacterium moriokaense]|uniref:HTH asnC-type domain-containing protein n=2 Tax=Mycolicibacterium moriokaense TaxID=39691 RepID=A0AAD1H5A9_9MYCO|nr:hypothetical protein MMOR_01330 [Mycolicibacterium moriokaense]